MTALDLPAITTRTAESASWVASLDARTVPDMVRQHFTADVPALLTECRRLRAEITLLEGDVPGPNASEPGS